MKLIDKPTIYVLSRPSLDLAALMSYVTDNGMTGGVSGASSAEGLIEAAGRICYQSFGKGRKTFREYIENILESRHGSVLEHPTWSFLFTGISRSLSHELVRHRAGWAYSQLSQRYVDESQTAFVVPPAFIGTEQESQFSATQLAWAQSLEAYGFLAERLFNQGMPRKQAREAARCVLPNATETHIVASANARAIRHFIEMRASPYADAEIRRLALMLLDVMREEAPNVFVDYTIVKDEAGVVYATTKNVKV